MQMVFRKNNGLADIFSEMNAVTFRHEDVQHFSDGVLVEQPLIQRRGIDLLRDKILILKSIFEFVLLFRGEIVVVDAILHELQLAFHRHVIHQVSVRHRLSQFVAIGRLSGFQVKNTVGIFVDFVLRGCRQAHQRCVEVIKNIPVFIINRPMGLIANHQVEVARRKQPFAILVIYRIDAANHGLVSGKDAGRAVVFFILAKIGYR